MSLSFDLLGLALLLVAAKTAGVVEKFKLPAVLGELVAGILLGNLALIGCASLEPLKTSHILQFLAELGAILLLFQVGLESDVDKMTKVGARALIVAIVGVIAPFALAVFVVEPLLFPGASTNTMLFLGATLTATSVGITARVFRDLGALQKKEAQIILGAAVIDDVLGLIILAVVTAVVKTGAVSFSELSLIVGKSLLFLIAAVVGGRVIAGPLGRLLSRAQTHSGMKLVFAFALCLTLAALAEHAGLAPIVGAFAAGLLLDPTHFRHFDPPEIIRDITPKLRHASDEVRQDIGKILGRHAQKHVEALMEPLGHVFVPLFFVFTGMRVDLKVLADPKILLGALALTLVAIIGKLLSGLAAGRVDKWLIGWGMVPRGEVGLIFVVVGKSLGVITDEFYAMMVVMVILTTLITPPVLAVLLKRGNVPKTA